MEFNIQKYLTENKLTLQSYMREEDDILKLDNEPEEQEFDLEDEPTDDWNKAEPDYSDEFEKEPSKKDVKEPEGAAEQSELAILQKLKKELVDQYKKGILTLDAYKERIYNDPKFGNIPKKIKDLEAKMTVTLDDEEDAI